jgi:preprotein translocase subunit SecG
MHSVLLIFHVLIAMALIGLILVQHGKGADMGAAFGSGASSTVFGARGSGSFLTTATAILAFLFFSNSFLLDYMATSVTGTQSVMQRNASGGSAADTAAGKDDTEIVDTKIEPMEVPAIGEETKAPTAQGDMPPIPGAAGTAAVPKDATRKLTPTAALAPTSAPALAATAVPQAPEAPVVTAPTPEPTLTPTEVPAVPATGSKATGRKAQVQPSKHKPGKKPAKPAAKSKRD